jgi:hypothetical protein
MVLAKERIQCIEYIRRNPSVMQSFVTEGFMRNCPGQVGLTGGKFFLLTYSFIGQVNTIIHISLIKIRLTLYSTKYSVTSSSILDHWSCCHISHCNDSIRFFGLRGSEILRNNLIIQCEFKTYLKIIINVGIFLPLLD